MHSDRWAGSRVWWTTPARPEPPARSPLPGQAAVVAGHPQPVIGGGDADAHAQAGDGSLVNVAFRRGDQRPGPAAVGRAVQRLIQVAVPARPAVAGVWARI